MSRPVPDDPPESVPWPRDDRTLPAFDSHALFKGSREVLILHGEDIYRLRQTQAGKLILTK